MDDSAHSTAQARAFTPPIRQKVVLPAPALASVPDTATVAAESVAALRKRLARVGGGVDTAVKRVDMARTPIGLTVAVADTHEAVADAATTLKSVRALENDLIRRAVIEDGRVDVLMKDVLELDVEPIHAQIIDFQNRQILNGRRKG